MTNKNDSGGVSEPHQLSTARLVLYGFGDTSFSLAITTVGAFLAVFLTDIVGISPAYAAGAIFLGRTWDYISDPLLGFLSDRTRSPWGRRRPYILFGTPFLGITFALLWWVPPVEGQLALAVYYGVMYLLFTTAATVVFMPYVALTPEIAPGYDQRTRVTGYRMAFSIAGSLVAFIVPLLIVGTFEAANAPRALTMGVLFGLFFCIPLYTAFFAAKERGEFVHSKPPRLRDSVRAFMGNKAFLYGMGIFLLTWITIDLIQALLLYYIKYVVVRDGYSELIMASIFVSALVSLPLWDWLSRRFDKRRAMIYGYIGWIVVMVILSAFTAQVNLGLIVGLCVLAGLGVGAAHVMPWSILPDAIEVGEEKTGQRHEGVFYSVVFLVQKAASSFAIPLALLVLEAAGYRGDLTVQGPQAIFALRMLMGLVPAVFLTGAIFLAVKYPLKREQHQALLAKLEAQRQSQSDENSATGPGSIPAETE
ncbi:MFS transporter [Spirochaeta lutea]|nr:MFS transporter [Spirochaeta lutea]